MSSTLVLAPDYQPVSYLPLSTVSWQLAIKLFFLDKVTVLEWHDDWVIHSAKLDIRVPSVVVVKRGYKRDKGTMRFSRQNLYIRDLYTCQYCNETIANKDLTMDHVLPLSKGGGTSWENTVTACKNCNMAKGNAVWKPIRQPEQPHYWRIINNVKSLPMSIRHESWQKYIGAEDVTVRRSA